VQPTSAENIGQAERAPLNLLAEMIAAAADAARLIRSRAGDRAHLDVRLKSASDFVSDVDVQAEECIRDHLASSFENAHIMGEELAPGAPPPRGLTFVVDPLDGTTNFLHGYPEYAVSIAAAEDGVLVAGVVHNAATDEVFTAVRGHGAWRDGERIHVSAVTEPARALIGTGFPFRTTEVLEQYIPQFLAVAKATSGIRRAGAAALDLCDVACGRFDAFWEPLLSPWDFAAGCLIVQEAGGLATDLAGAPMSLTRSSVLAGNPHIHRWLGDTVAKASIHVLCTLPRTAS
jgi:myo-inositol-1(or 4)-monophosphatase